MSQTCDVLNKFEFVFLSGQVLQSLKLFCGFYYQEKALFTDVGGVRIYCNCINIHFELNAHWCIVMVCAKIPKLSIDYRRQTEKKMKKKT